MKNGSSPETALDPGEMNKMGKYEVVYTFTVEAATPESAEELVDEACRFDHEEPEWLSIIGIVANVYELVPKSIECAELRREQ